MKTMRLLEGKNVPLLRSKRSILTFHDKLKDLPVGFVDDFLLKRLEIGLCDLNGGMPHRLGDDGWINITAEDI